MKLVFTFVLSVSLAILTDFAFDLNWAQAFLSGFFWTILVSIWFEEVK